MRSEIELSVDLLLPEVEDDGDACVVRLQRQLEGIRGISEAHISRQDGGANLCLHYDPGLVSLDTVQRQARRLGAEMTDRFRHDAVAIEGMDCSECTRAIEHAVRRLDGVLAASVSYVGQQLRVEYDATEVGRAEIIRRVEGMGYAVPRTGVRSWLRKRRELVFAMLAGVLVVAGWVSGAAFDAAPLVSNSLYLGAYLLGGWDVARHAWSAVRERHFDTDLLMVTAALGAAALGEWFEGALLLFLFSLGHVLEEFALDRARNAVRQLAGLAPRTATVRRGDAEEEVSVDQLALGDELIVRPGSRIPADGTIVSGQSAIDQSPVTGESIPVEKAPGDAVFTGTVNGDGPLLLNVTRLAKDNTLARVVKLVEQAQSQKSHSQQLTERFTAWFVPATLLAAASLAVLPLFFGIAFSDSFLRAMTLLVAASPCALALGTPAAMLTGVAQGARNGLLIKGGAHLETLGAVKAIAFDKTGTLTQGRPEVVDIVPAGAVDEAQLLTVMAAVERRSGHPLAQAIVRAAETRGLELPEAGEVASVTGRGLSGAVGGRAVLIGSRRLMDESGVSLPDAVTARAAQLQEDGKTTMIVAIDGQAAGVIAVADTLRPNAVTTIQRLRRSGIKRLLLLTGDNQQVGEALARSLQLDAVRSNLMPEDKVTAMRELAAGETVAMVGDGVNDAPALATASVGIAMGGASTDVALETADVALMGNDLSALPFAVELGRATRRVVLQNLAVAIGVIAILVATSVTGLVSISGAIVFHEGSTLLVVANALRLLTFHASAAA
ncbi:MAG: cadmium-translocating P-type ATPase [Chloroflexi bacterium]|nr:cadmium-translocating P-type ATPase [Chloroflexota bacterium]